MNWMPSFFALRRPFRFYGVNFTTTRTSAPVMQTQTDDHQIELYAFFCLHVLTDPRLHQRVMVFFLGVQKGL